MPSYEWQKRHTTIRVEHDTRKTLTAMKRGKETIDDVIQSLITLNQTIASTFNSLPVMRQAEFLKTMGLVDNQKNWLFRDAVVQTRSLSV